MQRIQLTFQRTALGRSIQTYRSSVPQAVQSTGRVHTVQPQNFDYNPQTARTDHFMRPRNGSLAPFRARAMLQHQAFVTLLRRNGITVTDHQPLCERQTPDETFPNGFIIVENTLVICPMLDVSRQKERDTEWFESLRSEFSASNILDLTCFEQQGKSLEGTGSMVIDRLHRRSYVNLTPRTDPDVARELCGQLGYELFTFHALHANGSPIYHSDLVLALGTGWSAFAAETVLDQTERRRVIDSLEETVGQPVLLTDAQVSKFCGNMREFTPELGRLAGRQLIGMSESAYRSLTPDQREALRSRSHGLIHTALGAFERHGGGSFACKIGEDFRPRERS